MSFCRITGRARSLPKPNFFPIIPPISPGDARRLCRITGKRMDRHNYVPLIEFGKRPECVRCSVTQSASITKNPHKYRTDLKYVTPILKKETLTDAADLRAFEDLQKILKRLKKNRVKEENEDKMFVYLSPSTLCGLILPVEVEEAIRLGEIENISISKNYDKVMFKMRGKPTLFVSLKEVMDLKNNEEDLFEGVGQSKETLSKQKKILEEKKKKKNLLLNKKIFEDLEKKADDDIDQMEMKLSSGRGKVIFGAGKAKKARQYREKLKGFIEMYLSSSNMSEYGPDWKKVIYAKERGYDWDIIDKIKASELDNTNVPKKIRLNSIPTTKNKAVNRRLKNVYIPDQPGLDVVPAIEEVAIVSTMESASYILPFVRESKNTDSLSHNRGSLKTMFANEESLKILPKLEDIKPPFFPNLLRPGVIYDHGDGLKYCENADSAPEGANIINGAVFPDNFFLPGEFLPDNTFIPGQRMNSANGEFIPGASVRNETGHFSFLPGIFHENCDDAKDTSFTLGQFICDNEIPELLSFVKGQVIHTSREAKFVEGETVETADGFKFVAGAEINGSFVSGTVIDAGAELAKFIPGQMLKSGFDPIEFIAGTMGEVQDKPAFIPGQNLKSGFLPGQIIKSDSLMFVPGEIVNNSFSNASQFLPGINNYDNDEFLPGMIDPSSPTSLMIEGKLVQVKGETHFVPGKTTKENFAKAGRDSKFSVMDVSHIDDPLLIDGESLSIVHKKGKPMNGFMVKNKNSGTTFVDSVSNIDNYEEIISGRMECGEDGPKFVPGKIMNINGAKTFIPGKIMENEIFVPGKMIETKNGPKFVPGQVIEIDGGEKFIPGQIMNNNKDGIPRFVPGQVIDTKSGFLFIPGQVIRTDNGLKFVPGQIVETENGALFVPGQVMDSPNGAKFIPGQIIETNEGPRLLPPDLFGDLEFLVQGFDINWEEARLLLGKSPSTSEVSNILGGIGGATVSGEALQALAEGFESRSTNVISNMGDGLNVDSVLNDELLDKYDDPTVRKLLKTIFLSVFLNTASKANLIYRVLEEYISIDLEVKLDETIVNPKMKLNPAIEDLVQKFSSKNPDDKDSEATDICSLVAGIITCSIPGALRESSDSFADFEESKFKSTLLAYIEESIQGILEEEGIPSTSMENDIKKLIDIAKDLSFDENQSLFTRITTLSEGRCSEQFMKNLLRTLSCTSLTNISVVNTQELYTTLVSILNPRQDLQNGFKQMYHTDPEFIQDVLRYLKESRNSTSDDDMNSLDILHHAISRSIARNCQTKLEDVMHKVELGDLDNVKSMLEQALGLAKYLGKKEITNTIIELLSDPIRLEVIKDDPVIKDVLQKILVMRKMACADERKRQKLEKLQRQTLMSNSEIEDDDDSLKEFVNQSSALIKPPKKVRVDSNKKLPLSKSKSMIKKSKSMVMSAKDISMNAFMAMKTNNNENQTSWLKSFLSESIVEDVPWECSKALVLLKEGYQAIIPREASRSILLGEASYTLIDDNGIEFFLSPEDNRKKENLIDEDNENYSPSTSSSSIKRNLINQYNNPLKPTHLPPVMTNGEAMNESPLKETTGDESGTNGLMKNEEEKDWAQEENTEEAAPKISRFLNRNNSLEPEFNFMDTSLEKYRPQNYEIGPRKGSEGDDINDIKDYYCSLGSKARAMRRLNNYPSFASCHDDTSEEIFDEEPHERCAPRKYYASAARNNDTYHSNGDGYGSLNRSKYSQYGDEDAVEVESSIRDPNRHTSEPKINRPSKTYENSDLDENTQFWINKSRSVRNNPVWDEPIKSKYDWMSDSFQNDETHRPDPSRDNDDAEITGSTLNPKTRSLLNRLRKSTADLEDINSTDNGNNSRRPLRQPYGGDQNIAQENQRRPSRFLNRNDRASPSNYNSHYDRSEDTYRPIMRRNGDENSNRGRDYQEPPRRYSYYTDDNDDVPSSYYKNGRAPRPERGNNYRYYEDEDRLQRRSLEPQRNRRDVFLNPRRYSDFVDDSEPSFSKRNNGRSTNSSRFHDDEDIDAMINDLKRKTMGRDMRLVASRIEGRDVTPPVRNGGYDDRRHRNHDVNENPNDKYNNYYY